MNIDSVEQSFRSLLAEVEKTFTAIKQRYTEEVRCAPGCDDCCHAVFSVSLVEEFFIERHLRQLFEIDLTVFERVAERAVDFEKERERKEKDLPLADNAPAASELFGRLRIRCPMLDDAKRCTIYEMRPLTCRAYGLPLSINGRGHVCGFSGFSRGRDYPTIKMDNIHRYLLDLSESLAEARGLRPELGSQRTFLADIVARVAAGR